MLGSRTVFILIALFPEGMDLILLLRRGLSLEEYESELIFRSTGLLSRGNRFLLSLCFLHSSSLS
jgi:hypothetical protein